MKLFTILVTMFLACGLVFADQPAMTDAEKDMWISSGAAVIPQIFTEFEGVDWEKYSEMEENAQRGDDMEQILAAIIKKDAKVLPLLNEKLKSGSSPVRRGILYAIQKTQKQKPDMIYGLAAAARDPVKNVRFHAAMLLSEVNSEKIVPALLPLLDAERDEIIRCRLAEGLVKQKSAKGTEVLLQNLKNNDMWIREAAANGLGFAKTKDVYSALERAIKTEQSNIVQSAIIASMNEISGINQHRLWDKYVLGKKKQPAKAAAPVKTGK